MGQVRQSLFFIIVGTNGTGKTTLLNKLISNIGRKALILDPDGLEWKDIQEIPKFENNQLSLIILDLNDEADRCEEEVKRLNEELYETDQINTNTYES